jgi:hypothetical protein
VKSLEKNVASNMEFQDFDFAKFRDHLAKDYPPGSEITIIKLAQCYFNFTAGHNWVGLPYLIAYQTDFWKVMQDVGIISCEDGGWKVAA